MPESKGEHMPLHGPSGAVRALPGSAVAMTPPSSRVFCPGFCRPYARLPEASNKAGSEEVLAALLRRRQRRGPRAEVRQPVLGRPEARQRDALASREKTHEGLSRQQPNPAAALLRLILTPLILSPAILERLAAPISPRGPRRSRRIGRACLPATPQAPRPLSGEASS